MGHEARLRVLEIEQQAEPAHVERKLGTAARTLFVGDTPSDVHAAREIGAPILSVSTGTFSFDELSALSPDVCVTHCGEFFSE